MFRDYFRMISLPHILRGFTLLRFLILAGAFRRIILLRLLIRFGIVLRLRWLL